MAKDTRERILEAALEIFSEKGYDGTNMRDIADSVGIVKSALYRHFESKEELWNAVFDMMIDYYDSRFGSVDRLPQIPVNTDGLREMTRKMVNFTVHDRKIRMTRKILFTEQFRDERVKKLAGKYFLFDTEAIFAKVFGEMMKNGSLEKGDPLILAFSYTAPVTALVHLCDREPEREGEAMEKLDSFIGNFIRTYGT